MIIRRKDLASKAYQDLVAMIAALPAKGVISEAEELVLFDILDLVIKQNDVDLAHVLADFLAEENAPDTSEVDEIVKATLMSSQLKDQKQRDVLINLVSDLTKEKKRLLEQG